MTEDLLSIEKEVCIHCNYIFNTLPSAHLMTYSFGVGQICFALGKSEKLYHITFLDISSRGASKD